ncbi:MAG: agmatinase [Myxococcota bacterium]
MTDDTSIDLAEAVAELPFDTHGPKYLESRREPEPGDIAMYGVPFDGTTSFRPGTRFGPDSLRTASIVLESYSPDQDKDLADIGYCDLGNLEVPMGPPTPMVERVEHATRRLLELGLTPLMLGGEHSVSTGAVQAVAARYPELLLVQFDAHADMRESYLGQIHNHACTMTRCMEIVGPGRLVQIGIRSGTREEFAAMREAKRLVRPGPTAQMVAELAQCIADRGERPIYVTVDLDAFDPGCLPGTGTPEPGGIWWPDFAALLAAIPPRIVAADVVELSPVLDPTLASSVYAAKVARELAIRLASDKLARGN